MRGGQDEGLALSYRPQPNIGLSLAMVSHRVA